MASVTVKTFKDVIQGYEKWAQQNIFGAVKKNINALKKCDIFGKGDANFKALFKPQKLIFWRATHQKTYSSFVLKRYVYHVALYFDNLHTRKQLVLFRGIHVISIQNGGPSKLYSII